MYKADSIKWLGLAFITLFYLLGCSIVPGGHIYGRAKPNDKSSEVSNVAIYPITASFIRAVKQAELYRKVSLNTATPKFPKTHTTTNYTYRIGIGDVLLISAWGIEDMLGNKGAGQQKTNYRVGASGMIYYPYVGEVKALGKTSDNLRREMTTRLEQYFAYPQLDVTINGFNSKKVYVTGEVNKPGMQAITNVPLTVLEALNVAGGVTDKAQWNNVQFSRLGQKMTIPLEDLMEKGNLSYDYLLQDGDIIHVPRSEKDKVFVMGEVYKPQMVELGRYGKNLTEVLGTVGGLNEEKANATGVFVIRKQSNALFPAKTEVTEQIAELYQLNMSDVSALALASELPLQAGDIIYVTAAPIVRWNRVVSNFVSSIDSITSVKEW